MLKYELTNTDSREFWGPLLLWVSENCPYSNTNNPYTQGYYGCFRKLLDDSILHVLFHILGCSAKEYDEWNAEAKEGAVIWGKLKEKEADCYLWEALPKLRK